jgi:hypothetical protein
MNLRDFGVARATFAEVASAAQESFTGGATSRLRCAGLNRHEGVSSGKLAHSVRIISPDRSQSPVAWIVRRKETKS